MKKKSLLLTAVATLGLTAATMAQNVPSYVPTNGLAGWWPFNGNANDESGNNNNGIVNGATLTTDRFVNNNAAYSFDGVNDFIEILNSSSLNSPTQAITISIWFKINNWYSVNNSGWFPIMSKSNLSSTYGNYRSGLNLNASGLQGFYCTFNSDQIGDTVNLQLNTWNQIVYTIDDANNLGKIYLNGILLHQGFTSYTGWTTSNTMPLILGMDKPGIVDYANGSLDDIGIWNRVLSQQEISDLYNGNICYQTITVTDTLLINMGITGFNPITYNNTIKIFPNPTNDHITIDYGNISSLNGYQLKITNSLGQQMFQTAINQQTSYISLASWTGNGLYFVHIIDPQGNTIDIRKIVLQ